MSEATKKRALATAIVGAIAMGVGPLIGFGLSMLGLHEAFSAIEGAPPEAKARQLAAGMDWSMYATVAGLVIGGIGFVVCVVSLFVYLRKGRADGSVSDPG